MATIDFDQFRPTFRMTPDEVIDAARKLDVYDERLSIEEQRAKVKATLEDLLRDETEAAIALHNAWIEKNGLPLAKYRQF